MRRCAVGRPASGASSSGRKPRPLDQRPTAVPPAPAWRRNWPGCVEPRVVQTPLCARILRYLESLFVFVTEPAVPPTNNAAERSLRHLVTIRKISGGSRAAQGTATRMTLASRFGTWRLQGSHPLEACYDLLASPQV